MSHSRSGSRSRPERRWIFRRPVWDTELLTELYQDRLVAFVDILGFSEMVWRSTTDAAAFRTVLASVDAIHAEKRLADLGTEAVKSSDGRGPHGAFPSMHTFSDNIVISVWYHPRALVELLHSVYALAIGLLGAGVFTRGAIVRGKLYDDGKVVFGQGLIDAYRVESRVAKYPRIVIHDDVRECAEHLRIPETGELPTILQFRCDTDGVYHLDILRGLAFYLDVMPVVGPFELAAFDFRRHLIEFLAKQLEDTKVNPSIFEKVAWFAGYYNQWAPTAQLKIPSLSLDSRVCPQGHTWPDRRFRFCPLDGGPLATGSQGGA